MKINKSFLSLIMVIIALSTVKAVSIYPNLISASITITGTLKDELGTVLTDANVDFECRYAIGRMVQSTNNPITGSYYSKTFNVDDMDAASTLNCSVTARKTGYVNNYNSVIIPNSPYQGEPKNRVYSAVIDTSMPQTLKVTVIDSLSNKVNNGRLMVVNNSNGYTLRIQDLGSSLSYYFNIDPVNSPLRIEYLNTSIDYDPKNISGVSISSSSQREVVMQVVSYYPTVFNVKDEYGVNVWPNFTAQRGTSSYYCNDSARTCHIPYIGSTDPAVQVTISKEGYNNTLVPVTNSNYGTTISSTMQSTLKVNLADDYSAAQVNQGFIQVNETGGAHIGDYYPDTNGSVFAPVSLLGGSSRSVLLRFIGDMINYNNSNVAPATLTSAGQTSLTITVPLLHPTIFSLINEDSQSVTDAVLDAGVYTCVDSTCYLPSAGANVLIKKDGYVELNKLVNPIEVGTTINQVISRTLQINVYDDTLSHDLISQGIIQVNKSDGTLITTIQAVDFSDGVAYANISPADSPVNISYVGNMINYNHSIISAVSISNASPAIINLEVPKLYPVSINALDNTTPVTGLNLNAMPYTCANDICYLTDCGSPLIINKPGYLNVSTTITPTDILNGYVNANLVRNLRINIQDDNGSPVTQGHVEVSGLSGLIANISSSNLIDMVEYVAADPAGSPISITYFGNIDYANNQVITNVNDSAQTITDLVIKRAHPTTITASDEESNPVTDFIISAVETCINNVCYLPDCGSPINISKTGYVNTTRTILPSEVNTTVNVNLLRTLRLNFFDDNGSPVNEGFIQINDSTGSLITTLQPIDFNDTIEYLTINPISSPISINYLGTINQASNSSIVNISDSAQANVTLVSAVTWPTIINLFDEQGSPLSDYQMIGDNTQCIGSTCYLPRTGDTINISKPGYVNNSVLIPPAELGVTRNESLQFTVRVNVQDVNSTLVNGSVTAAKQGQVLASASVTNGLGLLAINPADNAEGINLTFSGAGYHDKTVTVSPGSISDSAQLVVNMIAGFKIIFDVTVYDEFTQALINPSITVSNSTDVFCTSVPCELDSSIHPTEVNVTVNKQGYYDVGADNASVFTNLAFNMSSTAVIHIVPDADIKCVDTKYTVNTSDDETLFTVRAQNNKASIPAPIGTNFYITISEPGYEPTTLGTYTATATQKVIGSETEPIMLEPSLIPAFDNFGPVITEISHEPEFPYNNETINFTVKATDYYTGYSNITSCRMKLDNELSRLMNSGYDNVTITAWIEYSNLSYGVHNFSVQCMDNHSQWSFIEQFNIFVKDAFPVIEEGNETLNELLTLIRLQVYEQEYKSLTSVGYYDQEIESNILKAKGMIKTGSPSVVFILDAIEQALPETTVESGEVSRTTPISDKQGIVYEVIKQENQPFTEGETVSLIKTTYSYEKSFKKVSINGETKTQVTLTLFSPESHPNWIVTEVTNKDVEGSNVIEVPGETIVYWKGISRGVNEFSYVASGNADASIEPIVFEMPELSAGERLIRSITGFAYNLQQEHLPLIIIGAGIIGLIILLKIVFF